MGACILARTFSLEKQAGLLKPIIYCCPYSNIETETKSINIALAESLVKYKANRRTMQLEKCFMRVLNTFPDEVIIKDFDVMFNPAYQVDVLKIMITAYKKKPFSVIWPGTFDGGKLYYAEEGYLDYKVFNVEDYDVTCIV